MMTDKPVRLPRDISQGGYVHKKEHPLNYALGRWANMLGKSRSDIARALLVRPQTIYQWEAFAKADPDYLMPAEQVPPLCFYLSLPPNLLRPDLWPDPEWRFTDAMTIHLRSQDYRRA
jgi:hypothetical protein